MEMPPFLEKKKFFFVENKYNWAQARGAPEKVWETRSTNKQKWNLGV